MIKLQIWDSAGQERFKSITQSYYRGAHGIITVYDVTKASTFENIQKWLEEIDRHADKGCKRLLVGNKSDLEDKREVSFEHGKGFAEEMGMQFLETSAKNSEGISKTFEMMASEIKKEKGNGIFENLGGTERQVLGNGVGLARNLEYFQATNQGGATENNQYGSCENPKIPWCAIW